MFIYFIFVVTILGFIFGSFLNVVSLRFNTGKSINGRSMCMSCSKTLSWYELIPVVSWIIQKGRCRTCSSKISFELLASELLTGLFFGLIAARGFFMNEVSLDISYITGTVYLLVIFSILVVVLFYDFRHKIIPDELSLGFAILAFIGMFFFDSSFSYVNFHVPGIWNILAGILVPLPFALVWFFSKGRLIGLGDPKLMVGIGCLLGVERGFSAVFASFWIGSIFALFIFAVDKLYGKNLVLKGKKSIMSMEIPFAPFLVLGTLVVVVFGLNVLHLS